MANLYQTEDVDEPCTCTCCYHVEPMREILKLRRIIEELTEAKEYENEQ